MTKNIVFTQMSKCLNLEDQKKYNEAYTEYLLCISFILQKLQIDQLNLSTPEEPQRYFKCARECIFRVERIYNENLNNTKKRSQSVYELENQRIKGILSSGEAKNVLYLQRKYAENLAIQQQETYHKFMEEQKKLQ